MKQNTNVFVIIGLVALVCGKLHGSTSEQSDELNRLKRLDPSVAAEYEKKQDVSLIHDEIEILYLIIIEEIVKNIGEYRQVDFDQIHKSITEIINKIESVHKILTIDVYVILNLRVVSLLIGVIELLKIKKNNKKLSVDDFKATAQAIRKVKAVLSAWWSKDKSKKGVVVKQSQILSKLKANLYDIYEAEQGAEKKVTVLYDYTWTIPMLDYQFSIRLRSKPQKDLFSAIPSRSEVKKGKKIWWKEKLKKIMGRWSPI